jgi:hypothetical protein
MGEIRMLCEKGDVQIKWDENNPEEVKTAEEMFLRLKEKGHMFFKIAKGGLFRKKIKRGERIRAFKEAEGGAMLSVFEPTTAKEPGKEPHKLELIGKIDKKAKKPEGELIKEFDPKAEKIVATPPVGGG